jgi:RNA polymerase sigma-70 factor (ECF subfamily)
MGADGMRAGANAAAAAGWKSAWDLGMTGRDRTGSVTANSRVESPIEATAPGESVALDTADDRALVAAFLEGRREAFDVIVERHRRHVYQLCFRFMGNHEDAADLAQDVFVRAFKGLRNFKNESSLGTWLYRVAVNVCLNRRALKRPETEMLDPTQHIDTRIDSPLDRVLRDETAAVVRVAIDRLPPKQKATLVLRVYQELSHEEIATVLGSSVGAVKANFFHALGNLRRYLQSS